MFLNSVIVPWLKKRANMNKAKSLNGDLGSLVIIKETAKTENNGKKYSPACLPTAVKDPDGDATTLCTSKFFLSSPTSQFDLHNCDDIWPLIVD